MYTSAGTYGIAEVVGSVNFLVNGGTIPQPGCFPDVVGALDSYVLLFSMTNALSFSFDLRTPYFQSAAIPGRINILLRPYFRMTR